MADAGEAEAVQAAAGGAVKDIRYDWLQERVCSCLKVRDEAFQKLLGSEFK
jgi:hypothetical protein